MDRRKFLHQGSLSGLGLGLMLQPLPLTINHRRSTTPKALQPEEVSAAEWLDMLQSGKTTSVEITQAYLARIEEIDKKGALLNSVIEINPDALSLAETMDHERKAGTLRGPLHGIPILIKDNINTGDQMLTTAGSLALTGNKAKKDAFVVEQLRKSGAIIMGKTNLSEWANFRSTHSCSGWSSRGGQTKCPYVLDRNPSGSSAGSGTATAASLCAISVGSETDGSIVSPASVNGLVGIKPTVGLWSRQGIIPISATQDTAGPMARTVRDAVLLLGPGTGVDPMDPATAASTGKSQKDYTVYLKEDGLKGKRIGIEKTHLHLNPDFSAILRSAMAVMEAQGAVMVEVDVMGPLKELGNAEYQVLLYEFKDGLNKYLSGASGRVKSLKELIAYDLAHEKEMMPFFKQEILVEAESKGGLDSKEYLDALAKTTGFRKTLTSLMTAQNLDALSGITNGAAGCIDLVNGDYDNGPSLSTPAAITGFPHITVPMGAWHGLPVGLSFYAGAYSEPALIPMAYAYEQASKKRQKPVYQSVII